jgi:ATP-dependent DNA helicase RecG
MRRFQRGEIDVLVATTVIEVGVDVPNATVMVVEHAERFGWRSCTSCAGAWAAGAAKSYCILMTGPARLSAGRRAAERHGPHPGRI